MTFDPNDPRENASDYEMRQAVDPTIGAGTPTTAPFEDPTVGLLRRQPVLLLGLVLWLPTIAAAVTAWAEDQTTVAIISSAVAALIAALTPIVRAAVTPTAMPRDDAGQPLIPAPPL